MLTLRYSVQLSGRVVRTPQRSVSFRLRRGTTERSWTGQAGEQVVRSRSSFRGRPCTGPTQEAAHRAMAASAMASGPGLDGRSRHGKDHGSVTRSPTPPSVRSPTQRPCARSARISHALQLLDHPIPERGQTTARSPSQACHLRVDLDDPGTVGDTGPVRRPSRNRPGHPLDDDPSPAGSHGFHCHRRDGGSAPPYRPTR